MQPSAAGRREASTTAAATGGSSGGASGCSGGGPATAIPRSSSGTSATRQRNSRPSARSGSSGGGGLQPLQQKLQQHIDREDRRIKELTEGILYDFFPAALRAVLPPGADPAAGLTPEAARSVASAALTVATLMNAPPGFLEFLLCVPWADLGPLYLRPEQEGGSGELAVPQLLTTQDERAALVNVRLDPALMDCVLDFLFREHHQESLPPMIQLTAFGGGLEPELKAATDPGEVTRETVAALLDGATPLHCAAIRGNPAQVEHLLLCGADPLLPNTAGELPLEVVPVCGDRCLGNGKLSCRCMGARDQEAWECRSRLARTLILRRCVMQFRNGLSAWLRMALLCVMCLLGFWGNHTTLHRPAIDQHASRRAEARRRRLLQQTQATLLKMRTNAASGRQALDGGGGGGGGGRGGGGGVGRGGRRRGAAAAASGPPDPHERRQNGGGGGGGGGGGQGSQSGQQAGRTGAHQCTAVNPGGQERPEDYAYACYSQAVQLLKELELRPGSIPAGFIEAAAPGEEHGGGPAARVYPDEQAAIHCGWAEAALRKARACGCTGCAALAMHAVATGQKQVACLLASPDLVEGRDEERVARVGAAMARLVHCKAVLLLQTDVRQSATRAGIWRAQQCLQEWERLRQLGMTAGLGEDDNLDLQCLEGWCRSSSADLLLLEALQGAPLLPLQPLAEALPKAVSSDPATGVPTLLRPVGRDVVRQLLAALAAARPHASEHIVRVAEAVATNLQAEIAAGDRLRDLLQPRSGGMNVDDLSEAIAAAERYASLQVEVEQARALKERWIRRAEAQAQFDAAVESMSSPASQALLTYKPGGPPSIDAEAFWRELNSRMQRLESATEEARQANIGVAKAKRVLKELQAQGAAVEAATRLDEALTQPRCASAALKAALSKAEAAAAAAAPGTAQFGVGAELLTPRIQAAKQKLEVERAAEGLARAAATCKAVIDLPRLEAAILAARKVGAQDLDPEAYKAASELRLRLDGASKARGALEAALRNLQKTGRQDDADAVERCIEEAEQCGELLLPEAARAREAVQRWRAAAAAEARLTRALRDGVGTAHLSRAIKEAAAAGVKVGEARRLLKLMQGLEAAMQQATEGPFQYQALKARIEQAEAGGCPEALVSEAKLQLHRLLLAEVRAELDAVLKLGRSGADKSVAQRLSSLKAVLDKADVVLLMDQELQEQQQASTAAAAAIAASSSGAGDGGREPSECGGSEAMAASGADQQQQQQQQRAKALGQPRALDRNDTRLSAASSSGGDGMGSAAAADGAATALARADPGSGSSLPPGLSCTSRLESGGSDFDQGNPLAAAVAAATGVVAPSVYVSAAPSVQLEPSGGDADVAVLLEVVTDDCVQLSILLPAADGEGEEAMEEETRMGNEEEGEASEGELPPELADDELAVVKHMVRQARGMLAREEAEQARIEHERQEEARARREQQQKEKAERERADRERAEKARAERAERKAALEQQKAERRERERQQRLEKERQRQEREKLAKEHFALLQKQRRLMAQPPAAAAVAPPDAPQPSLAPSLPALALQPAAAAAAAQQPLAVTSLGGGGLFAGLPTGGGSAAASLVPSSAALELWAAAGVAGVAGFAGLPSLLQHAQHDRSDSLERLSEQQGLLDLLNDHATEAPAAAAHVAPPSSQAGPGPYGSKLPELDSLEPGSGVAGAGSGAGDVLRSPTATTASDGWEPAAALATAAAAGGLGVGASSSGAGLGDPAFGSGRWSSVEGSIEGLPGPDPGLSPEPSPLKQQGLQAAGGSGAGAGTGGGSLLSFGGSLWLNGGGAGAVAGGGRGGSQPSWSSLDLPGLPVGSQQLAHGANGSGGGSGLLWASSGNLAAAASPSRRSVQDDLALTGLGSRLWQSGAAGGASANSDGWAEVLGGVSQQSVGGCGGATSGSGSSLLTSPQRPPNAGVTPGLSSGAAITMLQQRRQQQLIAALDAAKAHLLMQQQQQQGPPRQVCKYFLHGFCREGDNCRFLHSLSISSSEPQQVQRMLGLQRLSGGGVAQPAAAVQQPSAGGVLSFGAPGAAAFAGSSTGPGGSGAASRSGTPDIRLGVGAAAGNATSSSGFSVTAPAFSPREPLAAAGSAATAAAVAAAGGFPPSTASLPAFAGLGASLSLDAFGAGSTGVGGGPFGMSRPSSAANSAFATPRDDLRLSAELESFEDALESQQAAAAGPTTASSHYRQGLPLLGGEFYGGSDVGEAYQDAYAESRAEDEGGETGRGGAYGEGKEGEGEADPLSAYRRHHHHPGLGSFQPLLQQRPYTRARAVPGGEAGTEGSGSNEAGSGSIGGSGSGGFQYGMVDASGQQDSYGLPSEASLFQDLPDFLRDTTDE